MKRLCLIAAVLMGYISCQASGVQNPPELLDQDPYTCFTGTEGVNKIIFDAPFTSPVKSYKLISSGELPQNDPVEWTLKGSNNGKKWVVLDQQKDQTFCSRYQEISGIIKQPKAYKQYLLEVSAAPGQVVKIGNVSFSDTDEITAWENFRYPKVRFEVTDPDTKGAALYSQLVQDPDAYIQYHACKVAEILFYTAQDTMYNVERIHYVLKDYDGVSAKGGAPPAINIVYSTRHVENAATESMYKLDYETRGVLFHELVHAYQFEPKGIGSYGTNKEFWACIEGLADAVRAHAGFFDISARRRSGGHWLDGYQTTGFFLQWLTTKDPDALRIFHETVRDMEVWSFDGAMKSMFGPDKGIEEMWNEYQEYLKTNS